MATPSVLVIRAAGINCEEETAYAWSLAGATAAIIHVKQLMAEPGMLSGHQVVTIPGGFSYGDDIASGKILAHQIARNLGDTLRDFVARGGLLLGICNGFQVLVKSGLLPGGRFSGRVTITHNDSARYEDRWVHLRGGSDRCVFLPAGEHVWLPVAHGEGKVFVDSDATADALQRGGFVAATYCDSHGRPGGFPINPNGSVADIGGLTDETGRIFGLMPHPERAVDFMHRPDATRLMASDPAVADQPGPGLGIFRAAVRSLI